MSIQYCPMIAKSAPRKGRCCSDRPTVLCSACGLHKISMFHSSIRRLPSGRLCCVSRRYISSLALCRLLLLDCFGCCSRICCEGEPWNRCCYIVMTPDSVYRRRLVATLLYELTPCSANQKRYQAKLRAHRVSRLSGREGESTLHQDSERKNAP